MKIMKLLSIIILCIILCLSCDTEMFEFANRNLNQPKIVKPYVECFVKQQTIRVYWDKDDAADEYYLYRSNEAQGQYNLIYQGNECSYEDKGLECKKWFYRLKKRRAETIFPGTWLNAHTAMGVSSEIIRDGCEDNDTKEKAARLYDELTVNTYYFSDDGCNEELTEVDWYKILVNPNRLVQINVVVDDNADIEKADLQYSEGDTMEYVSVVSTSYIEIRNVSSESSEPTMIYFRVRLNPATVTPDEEGIGTYQIKFRSESPIIQS